MYFIFDLDGTLCFDGFSMDSSIKDVLEKAEQYGHQVGFASARSYRDCLGILGDSLSQRLVVGLNGGLVFNDGRIFKDKVLDKQAFKTILSWCQAYNLPYFVDNDFNYSTSLREKIPFISSVDPLRLAKEVALEKLAHPIKMVIYMGDHEDLVDSLLADVRELACLDFSYHEHEKCLYINPYGVNKATTLMEVLKAPYVAFGNDQNDIEFFKHSLYAVQIGKYAPLVPYADEQLIIKEEQPHLIAQKIEELFKLFKN